MSKTDSDFSSIRLDIQGLRGLSVVLVILYHAQFVYFEGGFVGVDMFFVISGFVIFRSILHEIDKNETFNIGRFVSRRIRRIVPASAVVLSLVAVLSVFFLDPFREVTKTLWTGVAATFFGSNIHGAFQDPYFKSKYNPLLHYWSLGVEEQFYAGLALTFVVLKLINKSESRRTIRNLLVFIGISSITLSILLVNLQTPLNLIGKLNLSEEQINSSAFYLPLTRFWQMSVGALIAFIPFEKSQFLTASKKIISLSNYCGLLIVLASLVKLGPGAKYPGIYSVLPTVGAALIIIGGSENKNLLTKTLSISPLRFLGDISFGLYLIHFPVFIFVQHNFGWNKYAWIGSLALTFLGANALKKYVEDPIRNNERIVGRSAAKLLYAGLGIQIFAISLSFAGNQFMKQYFSEYKASFSEKQGITPLYGGCAGEAFGTDGEWCKFTSDQQNAMIVLVGDSHARTISDAVYKVAKNTKANLIVMSEPGCVFNFVNSDERCLNINEKRINWILRNQPQTIVVMNSLIGTDGRDSWMEGILDLRSKVADPNLRIVVVSPIPQMNFKQNVSFINQVPDFTNEPLSNQIDFVDQVSHLRERLDGDKRMRVIESWEVLCPQGLCSPIRGEVFIYQDRVHLNVVGGELLVPQIMNAVSR
jgi:peptidoglycan/LPS O-acetylase OafA/YrhL